ncbi:MAG: hypothetical protein KF878_35575 [Planctomycetes bacterium]|nr:hypothetical protein [Planctomycetota bacterium]
MSDARRGAYRASGSWEDLSPPTARGADRLPAPRGLFDAAEPAASRDGDTDEFLCVRCWEWHADPGC